MAGEGGDRWRSYFDTTAGRPPRPTLLRALAAFDAACVTGGTALDLGCGSGRDTVELLRRGWRVHAIDRSGEAIAALRARPELLPEWAARIEALEATFEDAPLPPALLVNASFALPLCPAEKFDALWGRIQAALAPGGRFAGQFYGPGDSWHGTARGAGMIFHSRGETEGLFRRFAIEHFDEEISDAVTPRGEAKRWHIFHVVARFTA